MNLEIRKITVPQRLIQMDEFIKDILCLLLMILVILTGKLNYIEFAAIVVAN